MQMSKPQNLKRLNAVFWEFKKVVKKMSSNKIWEIGVKKHIADTAEIKLQNK